MDEVDNEIIDLIDDEVIIDDLPASVKVIDPSQSPVK